MILKINNLKDKLITFAFLVILVLLWAVFKIPCPFLKLTGIPCPGCGMTRAYIRLLALDIVGAFHMHGMFWSIPVLILYYFTDGQPIKSKWVNYTILTLICVGFLANWIFHLAAK